MPTRAAEETVELNRRGKASEHHQIHGRHRTEAEKLWKALACIFMFLTIALSIIFGIYASLLAKSGDEEFIRPCGEQQQTQGDVIKMPGNRASEIFRGLTESEFKKVRDFLLRQEELNLTPSANATLNSNYIYMIEDYLPSKDDILEYIENPKSSLNSLKRARVVIFAGAEQPKAVKEYIVYPIPNPQYFVQQIPESEHPISWKARPVCDHVEVPHIMQFLEDELQNANVKTMLKESFGQWVGGDCGKSCLFLVILPRASHNSEDRHLQVKVFLGASSVDANYLYHVPFNLVIYTAHNSDTWTIKYAYYNDVRFESLDLLVAAYESGALEKVKFSSAEKFRGKYSSPTRRGLDANKYGRKPPAQYLPSGPRFTLDSRHVEYLSWSFDLYFRTVSGLQLFNIKHNGQNVAFEIGMQEIVVIYGGAEPTNFFNSFFDNSFSLGTRNSPLVRGADCPAGAVYVDSIMYVLGGDKGRRIKDAACIFETRNSVPLRRHYSEDFYSGSYNFAFSLPDTVLVVRQIITVWNYDYVFDYEFHQNGVIEAKVSSTGYIVVTNSANSPYGYNVNADLNAMANIHSHLFNFKFDVDIVERKNRLTYINFELENTTNPMAADSFSQMKISEKLAVTEGDALVAYEFSKPKYYLIQNSDRLNSLGHRKGYRVYSSHFADVMLPLTNPQMKGASWAKHQLAVTKQKDSERGTFSLYTQGDPYHPVVDFQTFYGDNESIVDEDIVAWVTVGMHHIPCAEDIPVTTTPGKTLVASLIPFNYFDEDPSISSTDAHLVLRGENGEPSVIKYLNQSLPCVASDSNVILSV